MPTNKKIFSKTTRNYDKIIIRAIQLANEQELYVKRDKIFFKFYLKYKKFVSSMATKIACKISYTNDVDISCKLDAHAQALILLYNTVIGISRFEKGFVFSSFYYKKVDWYIKDRSRLLKNTIQTVSLDIPNSLDLGNSLADSIPYVPQDSDSYFSWRKINDSLSDQDFNNFQKLVKSSELKNRYLKGKNKASKQAEYTNTLRVVLAEFSNF